MQRYEYKDDKSNKFWEIAREGSSVTTRWGRIGTDGQSKTKDLSSDADAIKEYEKLVSSKTKKGYTLVGDAASAPPEASGGANLARNEALERAIMNEPENAQHYLVYADWLQSEGNPRGELIMLMHKDGDSDGVKAFIEEHQVALLGELAAKARKEGMMTFSWNLGFVSDVRLGLTYDHYESDADATAMLQDFMSGGASIALNSITLGMFDFEGENYYNPLIDVLAAAGPRPSMKRIFIGDFERQEETEISWTGTGPLAKLWPLYPNLNNVHVHAGAIELGQMNLPKVRKLTVQTGGLDGANAVAIGAANWPELTDLEIWFGTEDYEGSTEIEQLAEIFKAERMPKLKRLGLMNAEIADAICQEIVHAPVLARLEVLDMSMGVMSMTGAKALAEHGDRFKHLKTLDVSDNALEPEAIALLEGLAGNVLTDEQEPSEDPEDRYVSVGE